MPGYMEMEDMLCSVGLFNACECRVDEDASAVFAYDHLLVHTDFHLLLRGDAVEAAAAGIALHVYDAEAVAGVFADALEGCEGTLVDFGLKCLGLGAQCFFLLACLAHDFIELALLLGEDVLEVGDALVGRGDVGAAVFDGAGVVGDMLLGKLDFERLEFDLFVEQIVFAVVAHVVHLLVISGDEALARVDFLFLGGDGAGEFVDFVREVVNTGMEAGDLVFKVLYFEGKLAANGLDAVDFREDCLKVVERFQTRLD